MDDKKFLEICQEENKKLASIKDKEIVSDELAYRALIIANNMKLNDVGDVMLFASALNILNTYVKQSEECKKAVSYAFKSKVDDILQYLLKNPNENIIAEIQEDNGTNLCIMSIFSIQFSFHCITVTEQNQCFTVLDTSKQKLHFDNIRKHTCSVTLYDFAYDNAYGRTNKMLDGSDFISELDKLVEEYRSGTKTIEDARNAMYYPQNNDVREASTASYIEKFYSACNRFVVVLSTSDAGQFYEKVTNRQIISELIASYADKTGRTFSAQTVLYIKYALEYFCSILKEANANPNASVSLAFCRIPYHDNLNVLVCSKDDKGKRRATVFELLNWSNMKLNDDGNVSLYDSTLGVNVNIPHPSMVNEYFDVIINSEFFPKNIEYRDCVVFFDSDKTEENNIIRSFSDRNEIKPTYYAPDRKAVLEEIKSVALYGDGDDVAFDIKSASDRFFNTSSGEITGEHEYVIENAVRLVNSNERSLFITSLRKAPGNTDFLDRMLQKYLQSGINPDVYSESSYVTEKVNSCSAIFNDVMPDESVLDKYKQVIVICDLFNPANKDIDIYLKEAAHERDIRIECNSIISAIGYSDGGAGVGWIMRNLHISDIAPQNRQQDKYPIQIVSSSDNCKENKNIKTVIVPKSFRYDEGNSHVISAMDDQKSLYDDIILACSGVCLVVSDDTLREYLAESLENDKLNLDECLDEDKEEILKKLDLVCSINDYCAPNSEVYNHYMAVAVSSIHQNAWQKLHDDSKDWVVSALSMYYSMSSTDISMDYSGPVLLLSKTFEDEMVSRISTEYAAYLEKRYGKNYVNHLPEELIQKNKNGVVPIDPEKVSLGSLPHIMGVDSKGRIISEKDHDEFLEYCNDVLAADMKNVEADIKNLCEIIYHVRTKYRNKAAHTATISYDDATDCVEYSITKDRILGVVMDFFRQ